MIYYNVVCHSWIKYHSCVKVQVFRSESMEEYAIEQNGRINQFFPTRTTRTEVNPK